MSSNENIGHQTQWYLVINYQCQGRIIRRQMVQTGNTIPPVSEGFYYYCFRKHVLPSVCFVDEPYFIAKIQCIVYFRYKIRDFLKGTPSERRMMLLEKYIHKLVPVSQAPMNRNFKLGPLKTLAFYFNLQPRDIDSPCGGLMQINRLEQQIHRPLFAWQAGAA